MQDEKKKELFPFFAYIYSKVMDPERYEGVESIEDWTKLIQQNPTDIDAIAEKASSLSDEEWLEVEKQASQISQKETTSSPMMAKKGAKLAELKKYKGGKKMVAKKCECGCNTIEKKGEGGTLVSVCSCGCGGKLTDHKKDDSKLNYLKKIRK